MALSCGMGIMSSTLTCTLTKQCLEYKFSRRVCWTCSLRAHSWYISLVHVKLWGLALETILGCVDILTWRVCAHQTQIWRKTSKDSLGKRNSNDTYLENGFESLLDGRWGFDELIRVEEYKRREYEDYKAHLLQAVRWLRPSLVLGKASVFFHRQQISVRKDLKI